jgi:hypothetical protein
MQYADVRGLMHLHPDVRKSKIDGSTPRWRAPFSRSVRMVFASRVGYVFTLESRSLVRVTVFPGVSRSRLPVHTTRRQLLDGYVMRCGGRWDAASIHTGNGEATSGFGAHGCTHTDQHLGQSTATGRAHEYLVWNLLGQFPYSDHATMLPREVLAHIGVESEILNQTLLRYPVAEATAID